MTTTTSSIIGQSIPDKNLSRLSLVGSSKTEMEAWVATLPIMNVGETAKRLYQTLQEITRLKTSEETRFELLEVLRAPVYTILQALAKHYLNQSVLLPERASRVATLAQSLRAHLAFGYKIVVYECVDKLQTKLSMLGFGRRQTQHLAAQSMQRAISELGGLLLESNTLYLPSPTGLWLDLHSLYKIANTHGLAQIKVADPHFAHVRELSPGDAYIRALILAASHTNKLRQTEIRQIYDATEVWVNLLKIKNQVATGDLLIVNSETDSPPAYITKATTSPNSFYIDAQKLVQHLQTLATTPPAQIGRAESALTSSLLQHLIGIWNAPTERTFARRSYQGELLVCLGLTATHYHLAGEQDFESVINVHQMMSEEEANFFLQDHNNSTMHKEAKEVDPWRITFGTVDDEFKVSQKVQAQFSSFYNKENRAPRDTSNLYPPLRAEIVNISPGGYCIRWSGEPPLSLRTGEILVLREPDDTSWNIGVIRWVKQLPTQGAEAGIEILSARAKPCGARVLKKTGESTEYMRTLLLPEMKSLHRPATLITPNLTFRSGYRIIIRLGNEEVKAQLTTENLTTQSFSQFEFALLQSQETIQAAAAANTPVAARSKAPSETDDFDSLWTNL
ncbi:hypothetical protein EV700_1089 [Fluviicoccus keumensis]|uniref:GTPase n=1 Tax=Fluviicoccus keumensis TaxID=1435465 RepID=A0A4Q7Z8C7_9GAMM|nr:hypothetical protein [Fluviicoccus keumensis]RZU46708.1 hypothetical protein EV700_1089 [Fluviicoccus keumensis]